MPHTMGRTANAPGGRPRAVSSSAPIRHAPPATLTDARLPRRARQALEHLLADLRAVLEQELPKVLQETALALARLPSGGDTEREHARSASMRNLAGGAPRFIRDVLGHIEAGLAGLQAVRCAADAPELPPVLTLRLLEDDALDDEFVLSNLASRIEARNSLGLQLLGQRVGVLAGAPAFIGETLPLGPHALCRAMADAAGPLQLSRHARMQLFRQFEHMLQEVYPGLLETFNARLIEDGILPHLRFVPMRVVRSAGTPGQEPQASAPRGNASDGDGTAEPRHGVPDDPASTFPTGFASLQALLQQRRSLLAKLRQDMRDERVPETLPHAEVLSILERMRASTGKNDTLADLRQNLLAQARQAHGHGVALSDTDGDSFELLGLFLSQLQRELRKSSPGETMLDRLRLPLAQLALRDQGFFTDPRHPARQLVEAISLAGAQWLAEDDLDAQWLGLLQRAAAHVQQDSRGTAETFAEANRTLQSGLQALDRKAELAERRQIEAARGRDRLELARRQANAAVAERLQGRKLPRFHATLMEQAWVDVLSLIHLRNGEDSDAWRRILDVTTRIVDAAAGDAPLPPDATLQEQVVSALEQVGYHAEDAAALASQLVNGQGDAGQTSRTELLMQLRTRTRLGADRGIPPPTPSAPRTPAEDAAYRRLRALSLPAWVDIEEDGQDGPQRRRLAWISEHTDQVLLVNRRGLRVGNDDLDGLARKLAAGRLRLLDGHATPATRAWHATLDSLQRIAPDGALPPQGIRP